MYKSLVLGSIGVFSGFAVASSASAANLVNNGDFSAFVPTNATGGGWTSSNLTCTGGCYSNNTSVFGSSAFFVDDFILNGLNEFDVDPTLEQEVTGFVVGQDYILTGQFESFAPAFGDPLATAFGVEIEGLFIETFARPQGLGEFSINFTATDTTELLLLTAERDGDDSSYRVDNISIEAIAIVEPPTPEPPDDTESVPEPVTILGGLYALGFGAYLKRKKQQAS